MHLICHRASTKGQILFSSRPTFIWATCVLPSYRLRWPGIIHPALHTPSPPTPWCQKQTKRKAHRKTSIKLKDPTAEAFSNIRTWISLFCSSALPCPLIQQRQAGGSGEDANPQSPTASRLRSAQTKRNVLLDGTGGLPLAPPPLPLLLTRLSHARERWSRDAL